MSPQTAIFFCAMLICALGWLCCYLRIRSLCRIAATCRRAMADSDSREKSKNRQLVEARNKLSEKCDEHDKLKAEKAHRKIQIRNLGVLAQQIKDEVDKLADPRDGAEKAFDGLLGGGWEDNTPGGMDESLRRHARPVE